jgi:adenine-specific DNA glycosylase
MLLKRTTSKAVARVFPKIIGKYPTLGRFMKANLAELEEDVSVLGLRKQRRKAFEALIVKTTREFGGKLPDDFQKLLAIPHVGPYSAGAVTDS